MPKQKNTTVDMPKLARAATFLPGTVNEDQRTVDVIWTTGAPVMRGYFDRFWEELSLDPKHVRMERLNNGAPLLNAHDDSDASRVVGVVEKARIEKGKGTATVRFAKAEDDPEADRIFRKVKDGILQNISVGYRTYKSVKVEESADKIPVYRAVDWEPHELSVVPMGADDGAGFRSADDRATNQCVFETPQERTMPKIEDEETTPVASEEPNESPAARATREASLARIEDAKTVAAERQAAAEQARAEERMRVSGIQALAKRWKMGDAWAKNLVDGGTSVEEARKLILEYGAGEDAQFNPSGAARIAAGEDERDKFIRGASAWLFVRSGAKNILEAAKRKDPGLFKDVSFDPGEFRGMSPLDLARECLERAGVRTRGMDRMDLVGKAFTRIANYQTIGDFPILLENVLGKVLLGAYATQINTWERITKRDEVPDFRTSNRYRTGSLPGLDVIPEQAEYQSGVVPDGSKYGIATQRMGKMFGLSRETIVNDDMSALVDMAGKMGQAAQRSLETAVYALILQNSGLGPTQSDSQPFFHSNRSNVNATGSALSVAGIEADAVVLANQKDPNALDYLDLQPAVLLVPRSLLGTGKEINDAQYDFDNAGTNTTGKFQRPNRVRGLFREVVGTPRLTGTRRYIIAEPLDWIVVAFLEGQPGPVMESQNGWRIDGVEWKVTLYAKPQMGDPKAAVTNAGT